MYDSDVKTLDDMNYILDSAIHVSSANLIWPYT